MVESVWLWSGRVEEEGRGAELVGTMKGLAVGYRESWGFWNGCGQCRSRASQTLFFRY